MGNFSTEPPQGGRIGLRTKGRMAVSVMAVLAVGLGFSLLSISSASAATTDPTHLNVSTASPQTVGVSFNVSVSMLDMNGNLATTGNLTDTVHFAATGSSNSLPGDAPLVGGQGTFSVTLGSLGTQTITVTDVTNSGITGASVNVQVNSANNATHFLVSAPSSVSCGNSFSFTVQAQTSSNTQANYSGTIHFSSSDPSASLPGSQSFDSTVVTFSATLETLGNQSITVSDNSISGSDTIDVVSCNNQGNAVAFVVSAPACVTPGVQFAVTVSAINANDTVDTLYTGIVHLSSSDSLAAFSANSQLTSGVGTFSAVLGSSGSQSITATDTVTSITGSTTVSTCQAVAPVQPIAPAPTAAPQVVQQVVAAAPVPAQAQFTG